MCLCPCLGLKEKQGIILFKCHTLVWSSLFFGPKFPSPFPYFITMHNWCTRVEAIQGRLFYCKAIQPNCRLQCSHCFTHCRLLYSKVRHWNNAFISPVPHFPLLKNEIITHFLLSLLPSSRRRLMLRNGFWLKLHECDVSSLFVSKEFLGKIPGVKGFWGKSI